MNTGVPKPAQRVTPDELRVLCYAAVDGTHAGGVQRMVRSLVEALAHAGAQVRTVWSEPADRPPPGQQVCQLQARTLAGPPWLPRRRAHLPSLARTARMLAAFRPNVVNVHFATRAAYNFAVLRPLFGYRLVLSLHGSDVMLPTPEDAAYFPELLAAADGVTAVSRALGDAALCLAEREARQLRIIPNGINTQFWTPGVRRAETGGPLRLISVGRLEPVKGFDVLIEALAELHRRGTAAHLTLIGSGSQEQALRAQAVQLGLVEAVEFTGALPPEDVRERFRTADMFVLSSYSEGMPLALMEAMACGLLCVATQVGGVNEITGGFVPLVEAGNFTSLANAIEKNTTKRIQGNALSLAVVSRMADYSADRTNRSYLDFLCEVLKWGR